MRLTVLALVLGVMIIGLPAHASPASLKNISIKLEPVTKGLNQPVDITHAGDGSNRLFITEQSGRIHSWDGSRKSMFLDISSRVLHNRERGLLGVAFHPRYKDDGRVFVNYIDRDGDTRISSFNRVKDGQGADPATEKLILKIPQPYANHNGGQLQFGPDGYLYIATGDGGSSRDPKNRAQNLGELLGKLLRIDIDKKLPYAIPPDNPFINTPGARPEIWAYGLRNPWRFSFDRKTGDLFIGDVGQSDWEEVNFRRSGQGAGVNFGWKIMEGKSCLKASKRNFWKRLLPTDEPSGCKTDGLVLPIIVHGHGEGECSVIGGYRYRGKTTRLNGIYFHGDYCSGRIWGSHEAGMDWQTEELLHSSYQISTFGEAENGELYLAHHGSDGEGAVYKIVFEQSE